MFNQKSLLYICTALESIEKIKIYSGDFENSDDFFRANDQMNFNATCRLLLTIGEEVKKISMDILTSQPQVDWMAITGLRNRMAHDYRGIDPSIVFDIAQNELQPLLEALQEFLKGFSLNKKDLDHILRSGFYSHIGYIRQYIRLLPDN